MSRPTRSTPRQRGNRGGRRNPNRNQSAQATEQQLKRPQVDREAFAKQYQANLSGAMKSTSPAIQQALDEISKRAVSACKVSQQELDKKGINRLDHVLTAALKGVRNPQLDKFARRALKEKYLLTCQQLFPKS